MCNDRKFLESLLNPVDSDDCSAQILINQEILSQLHQISQCLEKLEDGSKCKKTFDLTKIKNKVHTKHTTNPKLKKNK